jgi:hypothetical protein
VSFFPFDVVLLMTALVAFAVGLFRGAEFLLAGGDEVDGVVRLEGDILIGTGGTAAAGLTVS